MEKTQIIAFLDYFINEVTQTIEMEMELLVNQSQITQSETNKNILRGKRKGLERALEIIKAIRQTK